MLKLVDLSVARGGIPILEGVSFQVSQGEAVVLRGPNGSGKTTLLRCIAGLQAPVEGHVEAEADSIAYGGHADGLKGALTVTENLEFWAGVYGSGAIDAALQAFQIANLSDRPAQSLSAGQKRRLGLTRLFVTDRPVWVLDEPTVSLDAESVRLFADAVRAHLKGGGCALIATHIDLGLDARVVDVAPFRAKPPALESFL